MSDKRHYTSPTFSSHQKTGPPITMQERVVRLSEAVNELKLNVQTDLSQQEYLEKISSKNYTTLNTQIGALKKAFNTLADVMMEELDSIKSDIYKEVQESNEEVIRRVDEIAQRMHIVQGERQEDKLSKTTLEQDLKERVRIAEQSLDHHRQSLVQLFDQNKQDNKLLFEKLKILVNNNSNQLEVVGKDNEKIHATLTELRTKGNLNNSSINEANKKLVEVEEAIKLQYHELSNRIQENKTQTNNFREALRVDIQNILKNQTELRERIETIGLKLNERLDSSDVWAKQKFREVDTALSQIQDDLQGNFQELAKIHKDSSNQIILDFEKAITSCNNETKILFKKINYLETAVQKNREELGSMLSEHEHVVSRKNEHINKAIFDMCRQLNISNPLIAY